MKILRDNVLIQIEEPEKVRKSGIIIPDTFKERTNVAMVIKVGPGLTGEPMSLKVGDRVMVARNAGQPVLIGGVMMYIIRECDAIAVLPPNENKELFCETHKWPQPETILHMKPYPPFDNNEPDMIQKMYGDATPPPEDLETLPDDILGKD